MVSLDLLRLSLLLQKPILPFPRQHKAPIRRNLPLGRRYCKMCLIHSCLSSFNSTYATAGSILPFVAAFLPPLQIELKKQQLLEELKRQPKPVPEEWLEGTRKIDKTPYIAPPGWETKYFSLSLAFFFSSLECALVCACACYCTVPVHR